MPTTDHDRVIALAGLFQATDLVHHIAQEGQLNANDFETCIASLLKVDANSSEDVYGGIAKLRNGLELLVTQLRSPKNIETTRYSITLLVLERKLGKQPPLIQRIGQGIEAAKGKLAYFPLTHDNIIATLADVYANTISTLSPRIMVNGQHDHLSQSENANRIRALLLAGIRAAWLWKQSGGGRLSLLLRRKRLLAEAQRLLEALETAPTINESTHA